MNYSHLTTAQFPSGQATTPLRDKVAGVLGMAGFWALALYALYQWSIAP